jgi:hypothetical protein
MKTRLVLKPGKRGTRKLLAEWGRRLVCVRYRYDLRLGRRYKTAELIVDEAEWKPKPETMVNVRVRFLRWTKKEKLEEAGVRWDGKKSVWRMRYATALELGITGKIIED